MSQQPSPSSRVSVGGASVNRGTIRIVARFALGWAVLAFAALLAFTLFGLPLLGGTVELDIPGRYSNNRADFPVDSVGLAVVGLVVAAAALLAAIAAVLLAASAPGSSYVTSVFVCIITPIWVVLTAGNGVAQILRGGASQGDPETPVFTIIAIALGAVTIVAAMRLARDKEALG